MAPKPPIDLKAVIEQAWEDRESITVETRDIHRQILLRQINRHVSGATSGFQRHVIDREKLAGARQRADGAMPYGFPAVDGPDGGVKIAFYRKATAEPCTPETVDRNIREDDVSEMRAALRSFLPALDGELLQATTCLYTLSPDLHFVIGPHPKHAQVIVAAGFSGHGFKFCSVVGEILANLVVTGQAGHDIALFSPGRFDGEPPKGASGVAPSPRSSSE